MVENGLSVEVILETVKQLYLQKTLEYGNAYVRSGEILEMLFPNGIEIKTSHDHIRYTLVAHIVGDLCRYSGKFESGGHADSLADLIAYGAMLGSVDSHSQKEL